MQAQKKGKRRANALDFFPGAKTQSGALGLLALAVEAFTARRYRDGFVLAALALVVLGIAQKLERNRCSQCEDSSSPS